MPDKQSPNDASSFAFDKLFNMSSASCKLDFSKSYDWRPDKAKV